MGGRAKFGTPGLTPATASAWRHRRARTNAVTDEMEAKQLRKIQAAWIPFRDATCEVLYSDGIPIYGSLGRG